jgi:hypothetical protein
MDNFPVLVPVDLSAAWAEASVHLVINAGSEPIGKLGVETGPYRKNSSNQFQGFFERGGRGERTKVNGTVFLDPSDDAQSGKLLFHRESEAGKVFVIPQLYVIPRAVGFDEVVLQNKGFLFRIGDNGIDVSHFFKHGKGFHILTLSFLEIGTHPMFDIPCLPYIEDYSPLVLKQIDPGIRREAINFLI